MDNFYVLKITGKNPKNFIKYLIKNHINIYTIEYIDKAIIIKVNQKDFNKIKKIKTIYQINLINIIGLKKIKWIYEKYKLFFSMFMISVLIIIFFSNIIFKINIETSDQELKNIIADELENNGLTIYSIKKNHNQLERIKSKIKSNHQEIEWLEIETKGITYNVKAIKRIKNISKEKNEKTNIVAKKDGILIKIEATSGEVIKNPGDYVKKGDIIISGIIKNKENIVNTVHASGKVYAETWYKTIVKHPLTYDKENKVGKEKSNYYIELFGKKIDIIRTTRKAVDKRIIISSQEVKLIRETTKERKITKEKYSEKELLELVNKIALEKLRDKISPNDEILMQKTLKKTIIDDKINVEIFFKVNEEIGQSTTIQNIEEKEE